MDDGLVCQCVSTPPQPIQHRPGCSPRLPTLQQCLPTATSCPLPLTHLTAIPPPTSTQPLYLAPPPQPAHLTAMTSSSIVILSMLPSS